MGGGLGIGLFFAIAIFTGGEGPGEVMFAVLVPLFFVAQSFALTVAYDSGGLLGELFAFLEPGTPVLSALPVGGRWGCPASKLGNK